MPGFLFSLFGNYPIKTLFSQDLPGLSRGGGQGVYSPVYRTVPSGSSIANALFSAQVTVQT